MATARRPDPSSSPPPPRPRIPTAPFGAPLRGPETGVGEFDEPPASGLSFHAPAMPVTDVGPAPSGFDPAAAPAAGEDGWEWDPQDKWELESQRVIEAWAIAEADAREAVAARRAAQQEAEDLASGGNWTMARTALGRALDATPNAADLHARMAWYTHRCEDLNEFERTRLVKHHMGVAFEIDRDSPDAHTFQGFIFAQEGNADAARKAYQTALAARPGFAPAQEALVRLDARTGPRTPAPVPETEQFGEITRRAMMPRTSGVRASLVVVLALVAMMRAAPLLTDYWGEEARSLRLAGDLGTSLTLVARQESGELLFIDAGDSWKVMLPEDRDADLRNMAELAPALGYRRVTVLSNGVAVALVEAGKVCTDPGCLPAAGPAP